MTSRKGSSSCWGSGSGGVDHCALSGEGGESNTGDKYVIQHIFVYLLAVGYVRSRIQMLCEYNLLS